MLLRRPSGNKPLPEHLFHFSKEELAWSSGDASTQHCEPIQLAQNLRSPFRNFRLSWIWKLLRVDIAPVSTSDIQSISIYPSTSSTKSTIFQSSNQALMDAELQRKLIPAWATPLASRRVLGRLDGMLSVP